MRTRTIARVGLAAALLGGVAVVGCSSPDADGVYEDAQEYFEENQVVVEGGMCTAPAVDPLGTFLFSLYTPLQARLDVGGILLEATITQNSDGSTYDFAFQPLKSDTDALNGHADRADARTPTGTPIYVDAVVYEADGTFEVELVDVTVPGDANPVTGSVIEAGSLYVTGSTCNVDRLCGTAFVDLDQPLNLDLDGTFGAERMGPTPQETASLHGCDEGSWCENGLDDDLDGLIDCEDPDCAEANDCAAE